MLDMYTDTRAQLLVATKKINQKIMKKIYLSIVILFSIITTLSSCNDQNKIDKASILLKPSSKSDKKTNLDSKARIIYQDEKNNFWFSSKEKGVYRYDGNSLTLFTSDDGLSSYRFISVQEDNFGNLYFDTPEDVYKYDGVKFTTLPVVHINESENEWKSEPGDLWFRIG